MSTYKNPIGHSQNVLRSAVLVDRLLDASSVQPGELVLDLGAGTGLISSRLALRGCDVLAVEKDPSLVADLRCNFGGVRNVQVRQCNMLDLNLPQQPYKVFSNIPFDATADIVSRLTRAARAPTDAYLVVQREASERFMGHPRTTLVSVLLFPRFEASLFHEFRRTDFTPVPRVDVVMLRLHKRGPPLVILGEFCRNSWLLLNSGDPGVTSGRTQKYAAHHQVCRVLLKVSSVCHDPHLYPALPSAWSPPRACVHRRHGLESEPEYNPPNSAVSALFASFATRSQSLCPHDG